MAVPKKRHTKSRRNKRRMHLYLKNPPLTRCSQCKEEKIMHAVCNSCGYYKGREVIDVLKKDKKKEGKKKEQKEAEAKQEKPLSVNEMSKKK